MGIVIQIVFGIIYVVAGIVLSILYCFLTGWPLSSDTWVMVVFVSPAFSVVWLLFGMMSGHIYAREDLRPAFTFHPHRQGIKGSVQVFWGWTIYCLLPIILNWSSKALEMIGFSKVAIIIAEHRFMSMVYIIIVILTLAVFSGLVGYLRGQGRYIRKKLRRT